MWELIVIWDDGQKDVMAYCTEKEAEEAGKGYRMAFGRQISWIGIRRAKE